MQDFDELAGRIEGLGRALLHTVAALEDAAIIDGSRLASAWRASLRAAPASGPAHLPVAHRTLQELADTLDHARRWRQSRRGQPTGPSRHAPRPCGPV